VHARVLMYMNIFAFMCVRVCVCFPRCACCKRCILRKHNSETNPRKSLCPSPKTAHIRTRAASCVQPPVPARPHCLIGPLLCPASTKQLSSHASCVGNVTRHRQHTSRHITRHAIVGTPTLIAALCQPAQLAEHGAHKPYSSVCSRARLAKGAATVKQYPTSSSSRGYATTC